MTAHLVTTVRILETGEHVAECHTCAWCSHGYLTQAIAVRAGNAHEQDAKFGRLA